jgi:Ca2+-binding RTX toxin-like protein
MPQAPKERRRWTLVEQLETRRLLSTIFGNLYSNPDGDGSTSTALRNVTVFIDANDDGILNNGELNVLTAARGHFQFDNLPLGAYIIRHVVPPGLTLAWWTPPWPIGSLPETLPVTGPLSLQTSGVDDSLYLSMIDVPFVVIDGTNGPDVISAAPDPGGVLITLNGSSTVHSLAGMKGLLLRGGDGDDLISVDQQLNVRALLNGDKGHDTLRGGSGHDELKGGIGNDRILGGAGNDILRGDEGRNHLIGGPGNDHLYNQVGAKRSTLEGNDGNDELISSDYEGLAVLSGGNGNDTLDGGGGARNTLLGGSGNDKFTNEPGMHQTFFGGAGKDRFEANDGDHVNGGSGFDELFVDSHAKLHLHSIEKVLKHHSSGGGSGGLGVGGGCFLTSAMVAWAGKANDCRELTVLRRFRDGYMRRLPSGPAMIDDYYRHAPQVVSSIHQQQRGDVEWPKVHAMVRHAVSLIDAGRNEEALQLYSAEYLRLKTRYAAA